MADKEVQQIKKKRKTGCCPCNCSIKEWVMWLVARLVTIVVLTISDMGVFFSLLFMKELHQFWEGGLHYVFLFWFTVVGWVTYLVAVCYYGPRQKLRVMLLVRDRMQTKPNEFTTDTIKKYQGKFINQSNPNFTSPEALPVRVDLGTLLDPFKSTQTSDDEPLRFQDLEDMTDPEQFEAFRRGMEAWGLQHVWSAVSIGNAKNCLEMDQGLPILRIARYGFVAQPSATDLAGLLNANAIYSFTVGIVQLVASILMVANYGASILRTIPLGLSAVSFALCMANIIGDFPGLLVEMQSEFDEYDKIMLENKKSRLQKHAEIEAERVKLDANITEEFGNKAKNNGGTLDDQQQVAFEKAHANMQLQYESKKSKVEDEMMRLLEIAMERRMVQKVDEWFVKECRKLEEAIGTDGYEEKLEHLRLRQAQQKKAILGNNDSLV